jgi:carboxylate-amine ligase
MTQRKVGVEEELLLVDPDTHRLTAVAERAVLANEADAEVEQELFLQMIETSTPPCLRADELEAGIRAGRRALGEAAAAAGARAVAMAAPVLDQEQGEFTGKPRYRKIAAEYGEMARQGLVAAMHMHVDVADEEEAVRAVDGIAPWLPLLVALSANSPFYQGRDTGHASWRSQVWSRWPTAGPREPFGDPATYHAVAEALTGWGAGLDAGMLYFDARLSSKYPTVEIRVADVTTDVDDAVLVALLARALVDRAARGGAQGSAPWRADLLRAASWRAARYGLAADLVHPVTQQLAPPHEVFAAAVEHARDGLEEHGDLDRVTASFERLRGLGNGATRQRSVHEATGSLEKVVGDLADRTEDSWSR